MRINAITKMNTFAKMPLLTAPSHPRQSPVPYASSLQSQGRVRFSGWEPSAVPNLHLHYDRRYTTVSHTICQSTPLGRRWVLWAAYTWLFEKQGLVCSGLQEYCARGESEEAEPGCMHLCNGFCGSSQVLKVGYNVRLRSRVLLSRDASRFGLAGFIARLRI